MISTSARERSPVADNPTDRTSHVTIQHIRDYEFLAEFIDSPNAEPLRFDEAAPLGRDGGPNAAAVLGAAVGDCLATSLALCIRKSRIDLLDLFARVTTHVARNDKGRFRISGIDVELVPEVADGDRAKLAHCEQLFEDFCIVTESVRQGISVTVSVAQPEAVAK
jgi:uncharacterized OsmC-like protein